MRLKVLILPFFIVMILILLIGYMVPDFSVIQANKAAIQTKEDMAAKVDATIANINTLNGSLDAQPDLEKFAYRYLPSTQSQEQAIDAFNFLATQAGLVITKMELTQPSKSQTPASEEVSSGEISDVSQVPAPQEAKTFILTASVVGSYENIKAFFSRLTHIERFQEVNLFSLATDVSVQPLDTSRLVGTFEGEFGYLPPQPATSALGMPIFLSSKFDFSNASKVLGQATSGVPILERPQTGRPNPFQ